mgnify:CR=1 FL=1
MNLKKYFAYAKQKGFSDIEFKTQRKSKLSIQVFHSKVEQYQISENDTLYIRGIVDGKMVSGTTENFSNVEKVLDEMVANAAIIEEIKEQEIFAGSEKYEEMETHNDTLSKTSSADKVNLCLQTEKKAFGYSDKIADVGEVSYEEVESAMTIVNSKGLNLSYDVSYAMLVVEVVAKENNDTRTGFAYQFGQSLDAFNVDSLVKKACDDAIKALNGTQCESQKYKVLLSQSTFASFIGILMNAVSGDNVNKGKSLLKDKLNQEVASSKFTLIENPHIEKYPFFFRGFDDEGVATYKKPIVEKGVLKTFLYNIESAKEAKTTSTGNGYGGSVIGISSAFLQVELGQKNFEELCKTIKDGVYITSLQGLHSGMNPLSGDFSLQASGFMIEDGKVTTPLNLITAAGNLFEMFKNIEEVGNDEFLTYSGISSPSVYIKELAISGK